MVTHFTEALRQVRPLDGDGLQHLLVEKLRPHYDYQGLLMLRERAVRERDLRELYRGRAPYELLQNADDVNAKHAAFVLTTDGLAFLHDGEWFTARNFENLALGWSDKDPNVCIGNKGLGFRSVLDVTPAPHIFDVSGPEFFGVKFSYALNKGHIDETLNKQPKLRDEVRTWGAHRAVCPVMSIPGMVRRQSLSRSVVAILDRAAQGLYGCGFTTLFWLPASDPDISADVLRDLGPMPLTLTGGRDGLRAFLEQEVSALILFLRNVLDVRLYDDRDLAATVTIPTQSRGDSGEFSVVTEVDGRRNTRTFYQARAKVRIPQYVRNQPDTSRTLRAMDSVRLAVSTEVVDGRPVATTEAPFHVYFPTKEPTGVGFVVHGDFYVMPDRTRLMDSKYNDWLLQEAASLAAGPFLSALIADHRARHVFEALRPMASAPSGSAASIFVEQFGKELTARHEPFVPTSTGPQRPERVVLPPTVDESGVWDRHLGGELARVRDGYHFLLPPEDSREARDFLSLAGLERLQAGAFIDLIESAAVEARPATWWYGCFEHMAGHPEMERWPHQRYAGRRIVPISGGAVAAVPGEDNETILILPPRGRTNLPEPPASFARMLEFIEPSLANLIWDGDEAVRSWLTSRFRITTFEVTDFLQRTVQTVAPRLFTSDGAPSLEDLAAIWRFVRQSVEASVRPINDQDFWDIIGRLPLPTLIPEDRAAKIAPVSLVPAFLTYFPDEWLENGNACAGVRGLQRIAPAFLETLTGREEREPDRWRSVLERVGVSSNPKMLRYRRVVPGPQLELTRQGPSVDLQRPFVGRRQEDENHAVLNLIVAEGLWPELVADAPRCQSHPRRVVLSDVTFIDGVAACVAEATDEYQRDDPRWATRLKQLVRALPVETIKTAQIVTFCQQCRRDASVEGGAQAQLDRQRWVPTTFGPWAHNAAFLRLDGRRLIGIEPDGTELGDQLLPYAVADTIDEYGRFEALGVAPLDDAGTALPTTLTRFLVTLGDALADDHAVQQIVSVRARWRLVRGAVQDVYRSLNRQPQKTTRPDDLRLAIRTQAGVRFRLAPWYFAEPGSAMERAFSDRLSIIDADRPSPTVFQQLGIVTLTSGQTVSQEVAHAEEMCSDDRLRDQIVTSLAPCLLALLVGRSDNPQHAGLVARRMRDRFSVRTARSLRLALSLTDGSARAEVTVDPFYLHRTIIEGGGARREAAYTLYAVADVGADIFTLDGDALGEALAPVFLEGLSDELAPLFPRVGSRFQLVRGQTDLMQTFLLQQLGVTVEAQSMAVELLHGEFRPMGAPEEQAPAPTILIGRPSGSSDAIASSARQAALSRLSQAYEVAHQQVAARLALQGDGKANRAHPSGASSVPLVTQEQEARGLRGEVEIKRRLQHPEGWAKFRLVKDRRQDGCGYDFLCEAGGIEAKLEVKTFAPEGRVIVTLRELQEAHASRANYYLVGLCDDGGSAGTWNTYILQDPIERLLHLGEFQLETKIEARADSLFVMPSEAED